jgi:SEC-C motif domain protein
MRSRYSAYVMGSEPYLLATWHPSTRPASLGFEPGTKWLGLTVKSARDTATDTAEVSFVARYRIGGQPAVRLQERSRFVREDGRWFYLDGDQPPST